MAFPRSFLPSPSASVRRALAPVFVVALVCGLGACSRGDAGGAAGISGGESIELAAPPTSRADFGEVADFAFTERRGERVARADLAGAPWLAGFVFTSCSTICPALAVEMNRAVEAFEGLDAKVVAISVDPEFDTPERLAEFAGRYSGGDDEDWLFLAGDEEATHELIRTSFKLAVERNPGADPGLAISHSSLLVAIDGDGQIRGYYDGADPRATDAAIARMRYLAGDRSGLSRLPLLNATLNAIAAALLLLGYIAIKRGLRERHAVLMQSAFAVSAAFLTSYLVYHFAVVPAQGGPVQFGGDGAMRTVYFVILATHVVGAIVNLPMVLRTLWLARKERWDAHRRLARRTFPLWMYVSVTGVLVYWLLYQW